MAVTDLMNGVHDAHFVNSLRYGEARFDDRLAIIYGVASKYADQNRLNRDEKTYLVLSLLAPEIAIAKENGHEIGTTEITHRLYDVLKTDRALFIANGIFKTMGHFDDWSQDQILRVQGMLWKTAIEVADEEV